jgi:hypothetical protein
MQTLTQPELTHMKVEGYPGETTYKILMGLKQSLQEQLYCNWCWEMVAEGSCLLPSRALWYSTFGYQGAKYQKLTDSRTWVPCNVFGRAWGDTQTTDKYSLLVIQVAICISYESCTTNLKDGSSLLVLCKVSLKICCTTVNQRIYSHLQNTWNSATSEQNWILCSQGCSSHKSTMAQPFSSILF